MLETDADPARDLLARPQTGTAPTVLRVGFMPLADCAPLIVAHEKGFAAAEGLVLDLVRETSWASIRDRVVLGHFDAAHMLGPMVIAARLGLGHWPTPMLAPFVLNEGGNAVSVTHKLHAEMVATGEVVDVTQPLSTARAIAKVAAERAAKGETPLTFATVYPFSAHNYELRYWLAAAGIDPDRDIRLVVVPPPYMVDALASGNVDGFSVGAPWPSLAVEAGVGRIVATKAAIWPHGPEKVLGVRESFAERAPEALAGLVRALVRSAMWCATPANFDELAALIARADVVGVEAPIIERCLTGRLVMERGEPAVEVPRYLDFDGAGHGRPRVADGLWFASQMVRWGQVTDRAGAYAAGRQAFDPGLYDGAVGWAVEAGTDGAQQGAGRKDDGRNDGERNDGGPRLFDGIAFDPTDPDGYIGRSNAHGG